VTCARCRVPLQTCACSSPRIELEATRIQVERDETGRSQARILVELDWPHRRGTERPVTAEIIGQRNRSLQLQDGVGNVSVITLEGQDNDAFTLQEGDFNTARILLDGAGLAAGIEQRGNGLALDIERTGNGSGAAPLVICQGQGC